MGQVFVRASRRARAYVRSEGTRVYSSRHSAVEARKKISIAYNSPSIKTRYHKMGLKRHLRQVEADLRRLRGAGSRISAYKR